MADNFYDYLDGKNAGWTTPKRVIRAVVDIAGRVDIFDVRIISHTGEWSAQPLISIIRDLIVVLSVQIHSEQSCRVNASTIICLSVSSHQIHLIGKQINTFQARNKILKNLPADNRIMIVVVTLIVELASKEAILCNAKNAALLKSKTDKSDSVHCKLSADRDVS